jgi:large subunit ribosomal protein L22
MQQITHNTRGLRIAPRKLRLVVAKVRHMSADRAMQLLALLPQKGAPMVQRAIKSAIYAALDQNLDESTLVVQRIHVDEGTALKRLIKHSRGRSSMIMKKYSHLIVVLAGETKVASPKRKAAKTAEAPAEPTAEGSND